MRKLTLTATLLLLAALCSAQNTYKTTVEPLRNEKWWGVYVGKSPQQPFVRPFTAEALECAADYFTTPMMVSSAGRYIWSEHPIRVESDGTNIVITSQFEKVEPRKGGRTLREAYLVCCHKNEGMRPQDSAIPRELCNMPVYNMGLMNDANIAQEEIISYAEKMVAGGFAPGTVIIPEGWRSKHRENDFDRDLFPDPAVMCNRLHDAGFKIVLTVTPYAPAAGKSYIAAKRDGELLRDADGNIHLFDTPSGKAGCLDFTSAGIAARFDRQLRTLQAEYGIDGFVFDCREAMTILNDDKDMLLSFTSNWNDLGKITAMSVYSPAVNTAPTTYVNRMVAAGDELSWDNLAEAVNGIITAGLSGYIYTYYNLGNITEDTPEELLLHALMLSVMMPASVLPPSVDGITNPQYLASLKKAVKLRSSMNDYMATLLDGSAKTAAPLVRHLEYQFPGKGFSNCHDQYMIGERYLVAPVFDDSGRRTVRLPQGTWVDVNGARYKGPRVVSIDVSDGHIPVFTLRGK